MHSPAQDGGIEALIERQLAHADKALGQTDVSGDKKRPVVTTYDLELLQRRNQVPRAAHHRWR